MTEEEEDRLTRILDDADTFEDRLSEWEKNFIADQRKRYEEYGAGMTLSSPQWGVLTRIEEKMAK